MANFRYAEVDSHEQMQMEINRLIAMGYVVANQGPQSVTMIKRKEFSIPMLVIGLVLCLLPLLVYLIVYACQSDDVVEIRLAGPAQMQNAPPVQLTPDGTQWWDGRSWRPIPRD